jgi:hemolysin activation/secretion protein
MEYAQKDYIKLLGRLILRLLMTSSYLIYSDDCLAFTAHSEFRFYVKHFSLVGLSPLSKSFIDEQFKSLQDRSYTLKELQEVSKVFEKAIQEEGYPFYKIIVPPQSLSNNDVKLQIVSFTLGKVEVKDNQYFDKKNIINSLPALNKSNYSPSTQELSEEIKVSNKHPSKQVQLTFKTSEMPDKLDVDVTVNDQRPYQATLTANNYGTPTSGSYRLIGALQYSNLWNMDHIVNASYSTSPDHANTVQQYGGSYSLPIYRFKGWLSAYYASSSVNTGTVATDWTITGSGEMFGIHYQQFLPKWGQYEQSVDLGIDNRYFVNDIQFHNTQVGGNVRSVPFSALYKGEYPWLNTHTSYYLQWVANTSFGGNNSGYFYDKSRTGAKQDWDLLRYGTTFLIHFNEWMVSTNVMGQYSSQVLIAGEELGIGGAFDVRGYSQRETGADNGQILKFEVTTPSWQKMNLFTFYDFGHGQLQNVGFNQAKEWTMSGIGLGARVQWREYFMGNIAFATALNTVPGGITKEGDNRIHANIIFKY